MSVASEVFLFQPSQITGCAIWYDGADPNGNGILPANGANVSTWTDKSGNGKNATSPSVPIFSAGSLNKLGTLRFNGATGTPYYLNTPSFDFGTSQRTVFVVAQNTGPASGAASLPTWFWPLTGNGTNSLSFDIWIRANVQGSAFGPSTALNKNQYYVITYRFGSTSAFEEIFSNGTLAATNTKTVGGSSYANATSGYRLGWLSGDNNTVYNFDGNMGEVILFNTAVTTAQQQQVEGYLAWKWGLQASLPSNHPFRNTRPLASSGLSRQIAPQMPISLGNTNVFTPTQISGCSLWLDGADSSTVVLSGGSVSQWNDKSGNGRNATQTSATNRPTYVSNTIKFVSANQQWMNLNQSFGNSLLNNVPFQIFIVVFGSGGGFIAGTEATNNQNLLILNDSINVFGSGFISGTPPVAQSIQSQYSYEYSGSFARIYQNGTNFASGSTNLNLTSYPNPQIGRRYGGNSAAVYHDYTYSEIIAYSVVLTTAQRQQVEGYLAWKWGLQANLPANHPYKSPAIAPFPFTATPRIGSTVFFSPRQITACALWLDAADATTLSLSGTGVTQWNDKSGNGYNFSQASSARYPVYTRNAINGLNAISFTGLGQQYASTQVLDSATATFNNSTYSIFTVARRNASAPTYTGANYIIKANNTSDYYLLFGSYTSSNFMTSAGSASAWNDLNVNTPNVSVSNVLRIYGMTVSGSTMIPYYDGNAMNTKNGTTSAFTSMRIGDAPNANSGQCWNGLICEIVIYNQTLSTTNRQQIEGYLAWKWGLQASLPATHPFKRFPPSS